MINTFENFLPQEMIDTIYTDITNTGWKYGWRSSNTMGFAHWNQPYADHEIMENGLDISDRLTGTLKSVWEYIKENHFSNHILLRCYANAHTYGVEGYPHTDSNRIQDTTVVIYLNKNWRKEWGGETAIFMGEDVEDSVLPKYNRAVSFPGAAFHVSRNVTRICPDLRMTLMFKVAIKDFDVDRDNTQKFLVELETHKIPHGNRNLARHALCVYDLLKMSGQDSVTCLAGAFHSIYGTNSFRTTTLQPEEADKLISVIGEEAAEIARLFSYVQRPNTLEEALVNNNCELKTNSNSIITVSERQLKALQLIEGANLFDQNLLDQKRFPRLRELWLANYKRPY
jgi:hypothetical protein